MPEPKRHIHAKYALLLLDLSGLRPIVEHLYSPNIGTFAKPPEDMLCSLLAMVLCRVFSIDDWVDMMPTEPFYAVICGFRQTRTAGGERIFLRVMLIAQHIEAWATRAACQEQSDQLVPAA